MDTQIPELFPKMSILPPLSITGVECPPLPISYTQEKGGYIPPLLRSVPWVSKHFANSQCSATLRKGQIMQNAFQPTALRSAPLRSAAKGTSLRYAAFCTPLRSTRSATLRSFPPQSGFARSASLRSTLHKRAVLCSRRRCAAASNIIPFM